MTDNLQSEKTRLQNRIEEFYVLLNQQQWDACYDFIDPRLRDAGDLTPESYVRRMSSFFATFGPLEDVSVGDVTLYLDVRTALYDDRDFAYGSVILTDRRHRAHTLQERWIKGMDGDWHTRMVGLL